MVGPKGSGCERRARVIEDTSPVKPMGVRTARGAPLSRAKFPDCGNCDHTPTDMCFGWEEQRPTWGAPNTLGAIQHPPNAEAGTQAIPWRSA